jgi:MFS family permease
MGKPDTKASQVERASARHDTSSSLDSSAPLADDRGDSRPLAPATRTISRISTTSTVEYKVYKRRFFGLAQLCLLNIVVSWDWIAFAPVSKTSAQYFDTTESNINWVSTAFLFAFCVTSPATFFVLHRYGTKTAIVIAATLLLVGNWVKYGATKANNFAGVMVGQLIIGFAQPFVLSSPTSYSSLWFSAAGRTTATAVTSLSNPFGAALGQLISPFWADKPSEIPTMVLYISVISSVAAIPSFFIPAKPPSPPSAGSTGGDHLDHKSLVHELRVLSRSPEFYLLGLPFMLYVGLFNAFSSLINQILEPYGFSEDNAGIAGAILIVVGLVCAAVSSPLVDKYKVYLPYAKIAVPVLALGYLVLVWAPQSHSLAYVFVICALLGASSFGLVPVALEFLVEIHYPLGPALGSSLCWCGGQLFGGVFIVIMDALKDGDHADPPRNMKRALIFQAVLALVSLPSVLCLGLFGRQAFVKRKRWEAERMATTVEVIQGYADIDEREEDEQVLNARREGGASAGMDSLRYSG